MVSKKEALTIGLLVIGGIGAASMLAGSGDGSGGAGGDLTPPSPRAGGILGSVGVPTGGEGYNIPAQQTVIFPEPPDYREVFKEFYKRPEQAPISRGTAGVSAAPKKKVSYTDTGRVAVGYEGYKTPFTPTPFAPGGYWSEGGTALGYEGYVTPSTPTPIAPKKTQFDRLPSGAGGSGSGKGDNGTALPGRPYISKKPE